MTDPDFDFEPVRGLPAPLPAGETLLWQGAPEWCRLAIDAFHVRKVAAYFGLLLAWSLAVSITEDRAPAAAVAAALWPIGLGCAAVAILAALALICARVTVYSVTTKRVVLRHGVAVSMSVNLPFNCIESASCKLLPGGCANLALKLAGADTRIAYFGLWPHARPWHIAHPQPMLRAVPDGERAARVLADALAGALVTSAVRSRAQAAPAALGQAALQGSAS